MVRGRQGSRDLGVHRQSAIVPRATIARQGKGTRRVRQPAISLSQPTTMNDKNSLQALSLTDEGQYGERGEEGEGHDWYQRTTSMGVERTSSALGESP
jgi:hypothetical protein